MTLVADKLTPLEHNGQRYTKVMNVHRDDSGNINQISLRSDDVDPSTGTATVISVQPEEFLINNESRRAVAGQVSTMLSASKFTSYTQNSDTQAMSSLWTE